MKERPIFFSGEMVRAILAGKKTQTRRVVKGVNHAGKMEHDPAIGWRFEGGPNIARSPYGQPGDRLWVRETFATIAGPCRDDDPSEPLEEWEKRNTPWVYRADPESEALEGNITWTSSIHMPRRASRLTLEIDDVRVERLQQLDWCGAIAEGIRDPLRAEIRTDPDRGCVAQFRALWERINGPRSWDANPFVWVVKFRREEGGKEAAA